MFITDCASNLYLDLEEPDDLSVAAIVAGMRAKIGTLNNLIYTNFSLDTALEIVDENGVQIGETEAAILTSIYLIVYLGRKIRQNLGAASVDSILEASSDGGVIRLQNKNELAKSYIQLKKDEEENLRILVNSYKQHKSTPRQVAGDDTFTPVIPRIQSSQTSIRNIPQN